MRVIIKSPQHNNCHLTGYLLGDINCEVGDQVEICTFMNRRGKVILKASGTLVQKDYNYNSISINQLDELSVE